MRIVNESAATSRMNSVVEPLRQDHWLNEIKHFEMRSTKLELEFSPNFELSYELELLMRENCE